MFGAARLAGLWPLLERLGRQSVVDGGRLGEEVAGGGWWIIETFLTGGILVTIGEQFSLASAL